MPRLPKNQEKPYSKRLVTPIKIEALSPAHHSILIETTEREKIDKEKARQKIILSNAITGATEAIEKMGLLMDHYNIDRNNEDRWFLLSFALCKSHIEGFSTEVKSKKGSPQKWDDFLYLKLYRDIEKKLSSSREKKSISWACGQLAKTPSWNENSEQTLKNRYSEAENSIFVLMYKNMKSHPELENLPSEMMDQLISARQSL